MNFEILTVYENLDGYIDEMKHPNADSQLLWEKYAIKPFWSKLSIYAPFDISDRKPKPVIDTGTLLKQIKLLRQLDISKLKSEFERTAKALPDSDETMYVALYPITNADVRERQNGVLGTCTWGNMIINIDPLAADYEQWIPYVFAHEYHHNIWGSYWYNEHGGELQHIFINEFLNDGLADSFALSLYPQLRPRWIADMSVEMEKRLWNEHYSQIMKKADVNYEKYMFGDEAAGIPWCAGYAMSYRIVRQYIKSHQMISMAELLEMRPTDIFDASGYEELMSR